MRRSIAAGASPGSMHRATFILLSLLALCLALSCTPAPQPSPTATVIPTPVIVVTATPVYRRRNTDPLAHASGNPFAHRRRDYCLHTGSPGDTHRRACAFSRAR